MGLDMYAYKIKKDLVGDKQVDVPLSRIAEEAVGYTHPTLEQEEAFTEEEHEQEVFKWKQAQKKIEEKNLLDPDFWYWRKFNHLHGWMKRLYQTKGGVDEDFNCSSVRLSLDDLEQLEKDIKDNKLVPEEGFFFGGPEIYPGDIEQTHKFIEKATAVLKDGTHAIFYTSWW